MLNLFYRLKTSAKFIQLLIILLFAFFIPFYPPGTAQSASENQQGSPEGMVYIPSGHFIMGSDDDEAFEDEKPPHNVFIDGFYIDIKPVTNRQYKRFVMETGHAPPFIERDWAYQFNWKGNIYPEGTADLPVVLVSWHDAQSYSKWAGKRLPTEAEWEKAARGGLVEMKFPYGNKIRFNQANFDKGYIRKKTLQPVGNYPPNNYGLYDMAGNVWQWCQDWYGEDYYSVSETTNPKGPVEGDYRVFRGGSWKSLKRVIRTSQRGKDIPEIKCVTIGFRCALSVEDAEKYK